MSWDLNKVREDQTNIGAPTDISVSPLRASIDSTTAKIVINNTEHDMTDWAVTQFCDKLKIPAEYYKRCTPDLKATNANHWLPKRGQDFLFRTNKDGLVRAALSNRYNSINNLDLVDILYSVMARADNSNEVVGYWNDDLSFDIRIVFKTEEAGDDPIYWGTHISNSEVGFRRLGLNTVLYRPTTGTSIIKRVSTNTMFNHKHMGELTSDRVSTALYSTISSLATEGQDLIAQYTRTKDRLLTIEDATAMIESVRRTLLKSKDYAEEVLTRFKMCQTNSLFDLINSISDSALTMPIKDRLALEFEAGQLIGHEI